MKTLMAALRCFFRAGPRQSPCQKGAEEQRKQTIETMLMTHSCCG
jgi:hypothetical protein